MRILLVADTAHARGWYEPVHHLALHRLHHVHAVWLQLGDAIWILVVEVAAEEVVHCSAMQALSLGHWAVLVSEKQCLEVDNLFA